MPDDDPQEMTLELPDDGSTLKVIWSPADETWFWQVLSVQGQLIQSGMNLQVAGEHSAKQAMRVFVQFLVLAADHPLPDLYDATNVWAATRRQALRDGRDLL